MTQVTRAGRSSGQGQVVSNDHPTPRPEDRRDAESTWTPLANPRRTRRS